MFINVLRTEWLKTRRSLVWIILLLGPLVVAIQGLIMNGSSPQAGVNHWLWFYTISIIPYGMIFFPLLAGVLTAFLCRFEHLNGGWKLLLSSPVTKTQVYASKLLLTVFLLAITQIMVCVSTMVSGKIQGISDPIPWSVLTQCILGGWIAAIPIVTLQLWVSTIWGNFGGSLTLSVIFTLPVVVAVNIESLGKFYPWAYPMLAMLPERGLTFSLSLTLLYGMILICLLITLIGGWWTFVRLDVR